MGLFDRNHDKQFFTLLIDAARNLNDSCHVYSEMLADMEHSSQYAARLRDLEHKGDSFTHEVITLLNKMFITPLEREDILGLAVKLDDVTDNLEAAASRMHLYKLHASNRFLERFGAVIQKQAEQVVAAMERLGDKQLMSLREHAVAINKLENEGDDLLSEALEDLFDNEKDPIRIIKLKEIYETLELVTDRAEDVANALESVIMKNA